MKSRAVIIFAFALIPFAKGQLWFSIENTYILEATVVGTSGFLISLENKKTPIKGSFVKNIRIKAITAGMLAAFAIVLPVILYRAPLAFGYESIILEHNVGTMMTILLAISGFVVLFTMCVPFNKYRSWTMILTFLVAMLLGFMLPTSFIGGTPTSAESFMYDSQAGENIFDSPFFLEFFKPWNSDVVIELFKDQSNLTLIRVFIFVLTPLYLLFIRYVDFKLNNDGKTFKETFNFIRVVKTVLMVAGIGLIIEGLISFITNLSLVSYVGVDLPDGVSREQLVIVVLIMLGINAIIAFLYFLVGLAGYKIWRHDKKKYKIIAFCFSVFILIVVLIGLINSSTFVELNGGLLDSIGNLSSFLITLVDSICAVILMVDLRIQKKKQKQIENKE